MNVLVIGSGAREHAIIHSLRSSSAQKKLFCFPGSDAIFEIASPLPNQTTSDISPSKLKDLGISMVVIGPEVPLVQGLAGFLRKEDILVFGPSKEGAKLEGSKIYAKKFMKEAKIPTSRYHVISDKNEALTIAKKHFNRPYVLKVDHLAAGKGVYICHSLQELEDAALEVFEKKRFGDSLALLEEYQEGQELSYLVLTNGKNFTALPTVQDYKPLQDGNKGPNTGGMGAIGPLTLPCDLKKNIETHIVKPTIMSLEKNSIDYRGILYIGLIITKTGPKVLEYNVRFGDPEAQVILPLLEGDWGYVFESIAKGKLPSLYWKNKFVSVVVAVSEGYPKDFQKGISIHGDLSRRDLSRRDLSHKLDNSYFLHAGTKKNLQNQWITSGGRVLNAVGIGETKKQALEKSYQLLKNINFKGMKYRQDIGQIYS